MFTSSVFGSLPPSPPPVLTPDEEVVGIPVPDEVPVDVVSVEAPDPVEFVVPDPVELVVPDPVDELAVPDPVDGAIVGTFEDELEEEVVEIIPVVGAVTFRSVQLIPFPVKSALQVQVADPTVLTHVAFGEQ